MTNYPEALDVLQSELDIPNIENLTVLELIDIAEKNGLHLMLIPEKRFDKISAMIRPGFIDEGDPPDLSAFGNIFDGLDD